MLAPTFLVDVWGYTIVEAGFAIAPAPVAMAITAGPAGKLCARFGYRWIITTGSLISAAAIALWLVAIDDTTSYVASFLPGSIMLGIGVGIGFPMLTAASMRDVPAASYAVGAAGNTTVRQVALALGISVAVAIVGTAETSTGDIDAFRRSWMICGVFFGATAAVIATSYPTLNSSPTGSAQ